VAEKDAEGFFSPVTGPMFSSEDFDADQFLPNGTFFVSHAATIGFGWNTQLVPDGLDGYEDLLSDDFADGKIGIVEPAAEAQADWYTYIEEQFGEEYLDRLAELNPRVYPGGTAIIEALTSGEIYATPYASATIADTIEKGAPVDWELPETAWGTLFDTTVLDSAPHPNAAQVLANFILTESGQTAVSTNYVAVMPNIEVSLLDIGDIRKQPPSMTAEAITAFQEAWRERFL
jgi:iron(III) transport system substrate-binding protein